jgi:hypothetical protein
LFALGFDADLLDDDEIAGSPDAFAAAMRSALAQVVARRQQTIATAKALYRQTAQEDTAQRVFARMDELIESGADFDSEDLCPDDDFALLLDQAASVDEADNAEDAMAMYALLQVIRPDQPQPFINSFKLIWQAAGVKVAAECYALLAPVMMSPAFFYYAADCFENAGLLDDAKRAIQMAKEQLDDESLAFEVEDELASANGDYHDELCGEHRGSDQAPGWIRV